MTDGPLAVPDAERAQVRAAQARFEAVIADLTDAAARRASLLPGWSVGHVLTHVARNADSHRRRAEAALDGMVVDQYPGGFPARAAEIEAGAARSARALVDDVRRTADEMEAAWSRVPADAWGQMSRDVSGRERPLSALPGRRWQELEVHVVDLDLGVGPADWDDAFVASWLPTLRDTIPSRLAPGAAPPTLGQVDARTELAWLYGRLRRPDLPDLAPWG